MVKVKITGRGGHLWYKDFVGEVENGYRVQGGCNNQDDEKSI